MLDFQSTVQGSFSDISSALELGAGYCTDAIWLTQTFPFVSVIAIDKRPLMAELPKHVEFVLGDFSDPEIIQRVAGKKRYNLIYSCYALCFVKVEDLMRSLSCYFSFLKDGGECIFFDFSRDEQVVTKRTNIDTDFFVEFLKKYFMDVSVKREKIFEVEHGHEHSIIQYHCKNFINV